MAINSVPKDPAVLLSFVNTRMRDGNISLGELCDELDVDELFIKDQLKKLDYVYDEKQNRFL